MISLLKPATGSVKKAKRRGRGNSSGLGGESGRGHKGQKSRTGYSRRAGFEGGQLPLYRRLPKKRGTSNNPANISNEVVNLDILSSFFEDGAEVGQLELFQLGLVRGKAPLKILGNGTITKKLTIRAEYFSKTATEKLEKAGCKIEII